jgi:hypothetical protein
MATINSLRGNRISHMLWHGFGLSCMGSALFLQSIVFLSILKNGYFRGAEQNPTILASEVVLTGFAIVYFCWLAKKLLRFDK